MNSSPFRHIAIGGMSFSASTVTSYVLGSLPGCANLGESHWLTDLSKSGERFYCVHCGTKCEIWNEDFRAALTADNSGWYSKLAERVNSMRVISSDKAPVFLDRLDPERKYDLLVLYKPPELHARSYVAKMREFGTPFRIEAYLDQWSKFYSKYLNEFDVRGRKLIVDVQQLYQNPGHGFGRICSALGLEFLPEGLRYWEKLHHAMGGNFNPYSRLHNSDSLELSPLRVHPLEDTMLNAIRNHRESKHVLQSLEEAGMKIEKEIKTAVATGKPSSGTPEDVPLEQRVRVSGLRAEEAENVARQSEALLRRLEAEKKIKNLRQEQA